MFFADWLWSVVALVLGLKMIPNLLDTNSTHTDIAYPTSPHHAHVTTWAMYPIWGTLQEAAKITCDYLV